MNKIVDFFKIKKDRMLITVFILLSIIVGTSALVLLEPCGAGLGCVVLLPFFFVGIAAMPIVWFFDRIFFEKILLISSFSFESPSIVKLIPIIVMFVYTFLIGLLLTIVIIRVFNRNLDPNERKSRIKNASIKFRNYCILWIFAAFSFLLVTTPTVPFVSDNTLISYCSRNSQCMDDFLHYRLENCDGEKQFFLYPAKLEMPKKDICFLNNFIEKKPLETTRLDQNRYGNIFTIFARSNGTVSISQPKPGINEVLTYFGDILRTQGVDKRRQFCGAFSDITERRSNVTNQIYCSAALGIFLEKSKLDTTTCEFALTELPFVGNHLQKSCFYTYAKFSAYNPGELVLNSVFGSNWKKVRYSSSGFETISKSEDFLDLVYEDDYQITYPELDVFSDLRIYETAQNGPEGLNFSELAQNEKILNYRPFNTWSRYGTDYFLREKTELVNISGIPAYFEEVVQMRTLTINGQQTEKPLRNYTNLYFVKDNTAIKVVATTGGEKTRELLKQFYKEFVHSVSLE